MNNKAVELENSHFDHMMTQMCVIKTSSQRQKMTVTVIQTS